MANMRMYRFGFTIVELLIVVVVIAILATITVVTFSGIQDRARVAKMQTTFKAVEKAVALYHSENNRYPVCAAGGDGCDFSEIAPQLPIKGIPASFQEGGPSTYVGVSNPARWAVRFYQPHNGTYCKIGYNMIPTWWSSAPNCW